MIPVASVVKKRAGQTGGDFLLGTVTSTTGTPPVSAAVTLDGAASTVTATFLGTRAFTGDRVMVKFVAKKPYILANVSPTEGQWQTPTLQNATQPSSPNEQVAFMRMDGMVYTKGIPAFTGANVFVYPVGYRPSETRYFTGYVSSKSNGSVSFSEIGVALFVSNTGQVSLSSGLSGSIGLSGLTFPAER